MDMQWLKYDGSSRCICQYAVLFGKILLFAALFTIFSLLSSTSIQNYPVPGSVFSLFGGGILIGLLLCIILPRIPVKRSDIFVLTAGTLLIIQSLSNILEAFSYVIG